MNKKSHLLVDWNSFAHLDVLTFHVYPYKFADKLKNSLRHSKVLFPPVVDHSVIYKSLEPVLWTWEYPSTPLLASGKSTPKIQMGELQGLEKA